MGRRIVFGHHRTTTGEIEWMLEGSVGADGASLAATLSSALAAAGSCFSFEPTQPVCESWRNSVRLRPRAVQLEVAQNTHIGFHAVAEPQSAVNIHLPSSIVRRAPAFSSIGALLQSTQSTVSARVGMLRIELSERQSSGLRAAMRRLTSSSAPADQVVAAWMEEWMRVPRGWQLDCVLSSAEPLPESFLQLFGGEVFGQDVEILGADEPLHPESLDLSSCFHVGKPLPRLFPVEVLLASLRQPRSYNRALPRLPESGMQIGEVECQGITHPLRLPWEARDRHIWTVGATGTGKSSLLLRLIRQDIEAGEGVALIDPHGDLFEQVLASIPRKRVKDVVLLEPGRGARVPGLNFLEVTSGPLRELQRNFVVNELFGIFDQLWDMRECGGPMFQTYFRNAVLLLMEGGGPDATLTELPLVFEDRAFRERLKARCRDPLVASFWTNQAEKAGGESSLSNIAPYITSKLNVFTHSSVLRPIIGQARSTLDFRRMLSKRSIFLVNLAKGLIGDAEARLLGMLLLGRIFAAGMERATLPPSRRTPFSVYVDETQNFLTNTLATMLAEARKFGLRLTLANQNLAQLAGHGRHDLLQALLGNVGTLAFFRLGPMDARSMELYTRPLFDEFALQRLPNFHAVGRILTAHGPLEPLVFRTLPPEAPTQERIAIEVRRRQGRFTRSVAAVQKEIRARRTPTGPEVKKSPQSSS
ncbi:MAG: type IV secretion system DNA-binding domain-containing protein [Chthoniobacter sp.]|uniref:type IV secretory system conjugative DNA transfer family protein n=1 Tax=Chthoniobacter sp. TaxID=2510640 RepID=UPI0032A8B147